MEDDKSNAERPDLNQLNDAAKKAIENVAKEAVKAGRFVLASMAITNMDGNLSNTLRRLKKNDISSTQSNRKFPQSSD